MLAGILIFLSEKNSNYSLHRFLIFLAGILSIVISEINSEFLNLSTINNIIIIFIPLVIFIFSYFTILNFNRRAV